MCVQPSSWGIRRSMGPSDPIGSSSSLGHTAGFFLVSRWREVKALFHACFWWSSLTSVVLKPCRYLKLELSTHFVSPNMCVYHGACFYLDVLCHWDLLFVNVLHPLFSALWPYDHIKEIMHTYKEEKGGVTSPSNYLHRCEWWSFVLLICSRFHATVALN